jgi:Flp pilus assembly pilin Flp
MIKKLIELIKEDSGATVVEYAVLVSLIISACAIVIFYIGTKISSQLDSFSTQFSNYAK